jgi:uncharacterized membrane protein
MKRLQIHRVVLAVLFVAAGLLHFVKPAMYLTIMPPYLPYPRELVFISGVAEILGGLGVLAPPVRRAAGWGLALLLIAVFPANIQMAQDSLHRHGWTLATSLLFFLRLPLQFVLAAWVEWATRPEPQPV